MAPNQGDRFCRLNPSMLFKDPTTVKNIKQNFELLYYIPKMSQVFINKITGRAKTQESVIHIEAYTGKNAVTTGVQTLALAGKYFKAAILFK